MEEVSIIGIDLAKRSFQLHGARVDGLVAFRRKVSRERLTDFLASQPRCVVAMEACASAHHWGREIMQLGHDVRLVPPIYVKPFVKRQKNDAADAEAICEAAQRPDHALRGGEGGRATSKGNAVPHARSSGAPAYADDQRATWPPGRVRRRCSAGCGSCRSAGIGTRGSGFGTTGGGPRAGWRSARSDR